METKNAASLGEVIDLGVVCNLRLCNRDMGQRCYVDTSAVFPSLVLRERSFCFSVVGLDSEASSDPVSTLT